MRIGVLGGTFDPPHVGHLTLARTAIEQLNLEEVLFLPAAKNPLKAEAPQAAAKHRLAMVQRLIAGEPNMAVSDMEITRGGMSFAVDTMDELHMVQPAEYWFLVGADAVRRLDEWRSPQRLVRLCRLGVAIRPPVTEHDVLAKVPQEFRDKVDIVNMKSMDVSSSAIREKLDRGSPVNLDVPPNVYKYIVEQRLYRG